MLRASLQCILAVMLQCPPSGKQSHLFCQQDVDLKIELGMETEQEIVTSQWGNCPQSIASTFLTLSDCRC